MVDLLFYVVFVAQIVLISHVLPRRVLQRMKTVRATYPPSEYPKLYPKPRKSYMIAEWVYDVANRIIFVLGFVIIVAMLFVVDHGTFADDGFISEAWPAAYGLLQLLPFAVLDFSEWSQFRRMRALHTSTKRTAELRRRRLVDFVSPALLGSAAFLFLATIGFDLAVHGFDLALAHAPIRRALTLTAVNLLFVACGAILLRARMLNPHQAFGDRSRQIAANLTSMVYISMAGSVFFAMHGARDVFGLGFLDATLMSVYFQAIAVLSIGHLLRNLRLEDIDFEVYRNGSAVS